MTSSTSRLPLESAILLPIGRLSQLLDLTAIRMTAPAALDLPAFCEQVRWRWRITRAETDRSRFKSATTGKMSLVAINFFSIPGN